MDPLIALAPLHTGPFPRQAPTMGQPAKPLDPDHDPVLAAFLNAPTDDWQPTAEQQAELDAAKARAASGGRMVPHAEVMAMVERRRSAG